MTPEPLERRSFDAARLMAEHPPVWFHPNKQLVFDVACPPGTEHRGTLEFSRWAAMALPAEALAGAATTEDVAAPDFYDYAPASDDAGAVEWHVNFADPVLFVAYPTALFAQDEMQVSEHPVLGALARAIESEGMPARTATREGPTPILIAGAQRRCRVATDADAAAGRPHGLYGNAFAAADADTIRRATTRIDPPTFTNLIAMAAPAGGFGTYLIEEIEEILVTAHTGFRAAVLESERMRGRPGATVIHTGFWGCGAFGGNRVLTPALQLVAARMANVDRLVFHAGDAAGAATFAAARALADGLPILPSDQLIENIERMGFRWGLSDGN